MSFQFSLFSLYLLPTSSLRVSSNMMFSNVANVLLLALVPFVSSSQEEQAPFRPNVYPYLRTPPLLGFGTWNLDRSNATEAVTHAIQTGYRHIDCAAAYGNEKLVGRGIKRGLRKAGLWREDIWVTSKLWNDQYAIPPLSLCLN